MRKFIILPVLAVFLGLSLASAVLAVEEQSSIYLDYSGLSKDNQDAEMISLGGEGITGSWLFGGYYSRSVGHDPSPERYEDYTDKMFLVYTGYDFIPHENYILAGLIGYYQWKSEYENDFNSAAFEETKYSSWMAGVKLAYQPEAGYISLIYLYGVDNKFEVNNILSDDDFDFSLWEIKGGYYFTESAGINAFYRVYSDGNEDYDSFGLGVEWRY